ncbi:DUF742 domain-containing protein [Nocardiopsis salina]|uniref:DUF742 domain-containing protein n=1 Tax=Nocardiopsis salina TaxID=245836 RepID=UPI00034B33A6|nr:DUF742 domain-containing protein [Nocardiopsis salina]
MSRFWTPEPEATPIRPYSLTGGRSRPSDDLPLDARVITVPAVDELHVDTELHEILVLCVRSATVAEVAARVDLPVGVVRILLSDLLDRGLLVVDGSGTEHERPSMELMRSVLDRIREL